MWVRKQKTKCNKVFPAAFERAEVSGQLKQAKEFTEKEKIAYS